MPTRGSAAAASSCSRSEGPSEGSRGRPRPTCIATPASPSSCSACWTSPSAGVEIANLAWIRRARLALAPYTSGEALQNYADRGLATWKRAYYAENLERLVATKHAVDPANRFRHAQSIPTTL